jgi:hypothetical protein
MLQHSSMLRAENVLVSNSNFNDVYGSQTINLQSGVIRAAEGASIHLPSGEFRINLLSEPRVTTAVLLPQFSSGLNSQISFLTGQLTTQVNAVHPPGAVPGLDKPSWRRSRAGSTLRSQEKEFSGFMAQLVRGNQPLRRPSQRDALSVVSSPRASSLQDQSLVVMRRNFYSLRLLISLPCPLTIER